MSDLPEKVQHTDQSVVRALPSGRTVCVRAGDGREEIEIRSARGDMEVRIALTPEGPVLQLRGAKLEIDSTDTVAVNCKSFEVRAADGVNIQAAGDVRVKTQGQTWIDGDYVNLNCLDRAGTGYHDDPAVNPPAIEQTPAAPQPPTDGACGCAGH